GITIIISRLSLTNFRNYLHLEWDVPHKLTVLQGDNAQGKTNLLEAFCVLATSRSPRAESDSELIHWQARQDPIGAARLWAEVKRASGQLQVEVALQEQKATIHQDENSIDPHLPWSVQKRIRVNGVGRRASNLIGQINVVMFSSQDIDIIGGPPALRRRFLDIAISQGDSVYLRHLQRYQNVLLQRNNLLRLIREKQAQPEQLDFWNEALMESGSYLIFQRHSMVSALEEKAQDIHLKLSRHEVLDMIYWPRFDKEKDQIPPPFVDVESIKPILRQGLKECEREEIRLGVSLVGPHRDDLQFLVNEIDARCYASRGQLRTIALSLKLAEAQVIKDQKGDSPILLLDDVLSELDARRRRLLQETATNYEQVLITTTDWDHLEPGLLAQAAKFQVSEGKLQEFRGAL
ncbi:MAG: DNA replication/repair protein RecF, partial [Chloroflexi bacterium]|nr:DNA replication/repair protein RecF [Chloroflexota bacterium]